MTLNNIIQTLKSAYQIWVKKIAQLINSPAITNLIKQVQNIARSWAKSVVDFIKSDKVKNRVSAAQKFFIDTANTIKVTIIQSERFKHYVRLARSQTALVFEWMAKTAKRVFRRQTFDKFVLQAKAYLSTIQQNIVAHKRLSAAIAVLLVVFLIWPGDPVQPPPPIQITSLTPTPEKISPTEKMLTIEPIAPDFGIFAAGSARKNAFFAYFSPLIEKTNRSVIDSRQALLVWSQQTSDLGDDEKRQVKRMAAYYRINKFDIQNNDDWQELLARVNVIPASLALAQAANESAWGTSRFAREANNYYGQWCFQKGCGLVPAKRDEGKTHEVAAFKSPEESVEKYIHNLNSHRAYKTLRTIRKQLSTDNESITGLELAEGLLQYSERGKPYIDELQSMIKFNQLTRFD